MVSNYKPINEPKEFIYISGKGRYARTVNPDTTYDKWSIAVYPTQADMAKVQGLLDKGIRNKLKKDDDGYYITFSRPIKIKLRNGTFKPMDPPNVIDKDGNPFTGFIGDESDVTVKLETYGGPGPQGKGSYYAARLAGVKINTLVPWDKPIDEPKVPEVSEPEPW